MSEQVLERFEEAWQDGNPPAIDELLAGAGADRCSLLEELVKIDLEYRWRHSSTGRPPLLESYITRHPDLGRPDQLPVSLIGWEYLVRCRYGDRPSPEEYADRFAHHGEPLRAELRRVDAELAAEFCRKPSLALGAGKNSSLTLGAGGPSASAALLMAAPVTSVPSIQSLMEAFADFRLLTASQLDQLAGETFADPRSLGRALLQRGWLTAYQLNQVFRGRAGDLLLGPYLLLERLGEGGVGQVFKAHHQKLDRVVALKVIRKDLLADEEVVGRFYREMEIVGRLSHPNIVQAYDAGPVGATHVLVMEYVEGIDLGRLVKQAGPLPIAQACDYIRQAACGLAHAQERGLVHRDIKPSNLLVSGGVVSSGVVNDGSASSGHHSLLTTHHSPLHHSPLTTHQIKLLDMGLARLQWKVNGEATNLNTPLGAAIIGTPDYLAPEQALDFHAADIRSDIYSLGCTLFYLLTGQPPFPGGTLTEKLLRHQQADPPPLDQLRPEAPPALALVLSRMLAKRPEMRYQAPAEVVEALRLAADPNQPSLPRAIPWRAGGVSHPSEPGVAAALLGGLTPPARQEGQRPRKMLRRLVIAASGVVAAVLLLAAILPRWPTPPPTPPQLGPAADLEKLCAHLADSGVSLEDAWADFQAFRRRHPGTPEEDQAVYLLRHYLFTIRSRSPGTPRADRARSLLHQLPWPPDRLDRKDIPRAERPSRPPPELVAVFGKRGRPAVGSVAVHPDGLFVAGGGFDHSVRLWDAATGREVRAWEGLAGPVRALAFSPDGLTLAAGVPDGSVKMWEVAGGNEWFDLPASSKAAAVTHLAFAPDGKSLATATAKGTVRLWLLASRKDRVLLKGNADRAVHGLAYSPDGRLLAVVVRPGVVKFWELPAGRSLPDLKVPGAHAIAFAPGNRSLAVGLNSPHVVKLYETDGRRELRTLRSGQPMLGHSLAFTPSGRQLISAGARGLVLWWDASSAQEQGRRTMPGQVLHDAALAPDGRHLVLASGNGTVFVFRLAP